MVMRVFSLPTIPTGRSKQRRYSPNKKPLAGSDRERFEQADIVWSIALQTPLSRTLGMESRTAREQTAKRRRKHAISRSILEE
jgi:hypothetical protein